MTSERLLEPTFMIKRSRLKGRFKNVNFKSRWFILTGSCLTYHDGGATQDPGKERGRLYLRDVKAIEQTDHEHLGGRPNAFQIAYTEEGSFDTTILYIMAVSPEQRDEWMKALVSACSTLGNKFLDRYHCGVWSFKQGRWSCCDKISKTSEGCQACTNKISPLTNGTSSATTTSRQPVPLPPPKPANSTPALKKAVALYPYEGVHEGDLNLETGEEYEVIDDTKEHWWKAKNKRGKVGFIPSNYVDILKDDGLEKYGWYYKGVSRSESESILKNEKKEGCFLVRDSSQKGMYTLSLYTMEVSDGMTRHYHIKKNSEGKIFLSEKHAFDTIPDLVNYHKHNSGGLVVRLRTPPSDRQENIPATVGLGNDKYELDPNDIVLGETLGSGQFGIVKKGKYRGSKEVAVKTMNSGTMREDDFIEEARTMLQFQHRHLVQLYGVCTITRPIYIILEFMTHGALLTHLKRRKGTLLQKPDTLLYMCLQVCDAMRYLESKQCIHRDLAARNCLVGENNIVKVGDFGLARYVLDDEYTSSSGTKFPVKWAPPEVLGYTKFSSKSDVWAFGITIWEVWTGGDMPYGRMRNPEVVEKVCHQNYKLSKPPVCPENVYEVMKECWRTEPEHRPPFSDIYANLEVIQKQLEDYMD